MPGSGHHRAKNIDYDDDDAYSNEDYYEEEEGGVADGMKLFRLLSADY
jgi:hypothetical protein